MAVEQSSEEKRIHREIFEEAAKRLIPASAYLVNPVAGFAASVWVFTTWLLLRRRRGGGGGYREAADDVVEITERIRELDEMIARRRKALGMARGEAAEMLREEISVLEKEREILARRKKVLVLRMMAWRLVELTGDPGLRRELRRLEEILEKNPREAGPGAARVLARLEEMLERGEIKENVLESMLSEMLGKKSVF